MIWLSAVPGAMVSKSLKKTVAISSAAGGSGALVGSEIAKKK